MDIQTKIENLLAEMRVYEYIENLLYEYWESLPNPKLPYTEWFYMNNGPKDFLDKLLRGKPCNL